MKKYVALSLLLLSSLAVASPNPDQLGICYLFNKNTLVNKGVCVVSSGGGAGGFYYNIDYKDKNYSFEFANDDESLIYYRDSFYNVITKETEEYVDDNERITCFEHKPHDICYL